MKKIIVKDVSVFFGIVSILLIFYFQPWFSTIQIALGIGGASIVGLFVFVFIKTKVSIIKYLIELWNTKLSLLWSVKKIIHTKYDTRLIDTIFAFYTHWYETNSSEIENIREFPTEEFPKGKFELAERYAYIKDIRKHNNLQMSKLDYDTEKEKVVLYSMKFNSFRCYFHNYNLTIHGMDDEPISHFQYLSMRIKLSKKIYDLDTDVANWIIKNRNHFGF
jgi:hypothetical protein